MHAHYMKICEVNLKFVPFLPSEKKFPFHFVYHNLCYPGNTSRYSSYGHQVVAGLPLGMYFHQTTFLMFSSQMQILVLYCTGCSLKCRYLFLNRNSEGQWKSRERITDLTLFGNNNLSVIHCVHIMPLTNLGVVALCRVKGLKAVCTGEINTWNDSLSIST